MGSTLVHDTELMQYINLYCIWTGLSCKWLEYHHISPSIDRKKNKNFFSLVRLLVLPFIFISVEVKANRCVADAFIHSVELGGGENVQENDKLVVNSRLKPQIQWPPQSYLPTVCERHSKSQHWHQSPDLKSTNVKTDMVGSGQK